MGRQGRWSESTLEGNELGVARSAEGWARVKTLGTLGSNAESNAWGRGACPSRSPWTERLGRSGRPGSEWSGVTEAAVSSARGWEQAPRGVG